jgi:hypothetical protein
LFISELSGGSPDLVLPSHSVGSSQHYPAPNSNSNSTTSNGGSGHFQSTENGQQFGGWAVTTTNGTTASSGGHESVVSLDSCSIQYGGASGTSNGGGGGGYQSVSSCPAENQDAHQQVTWTSVPAESVSPSKGGGKKPANSAGIKMADRQNKVESTGNNSNKIPSTSTPATAAAAVVKATKKAKGSSLSKVQHAQNGKVGVVAKNNNFHYQYWNRFLIVIGLYIYICILAYSYWHVPITTT